MNLFFLQVPNYRKLPIFIEIIFGENIKSLSIVNNYLVKYHINTNIF